MKLSTDDVTDKRWLLTDDDFPAEPFDHDEDHDEEQDEEEESV